MATTEENDLIGYDPLAWMEGGVVSEEPLLADDSDNESVRSEQSQTKKQAHMDNEIIMINDYPEDLIEDTGDGEVLSDFADVCPELSRTDDPDVTNQDEIIMDEIIMDEIEGQSGSTKLDEIADACSDVDTVNVDAEEVVEAQIDLDATLTIQNVVKLHEKLKNALAIHDEIEINASDVASIDTATLQLLVSLKKDADKLQKQVSIIYPSPRFIESAQLLGLLDVLDVAGF
ncbi:MAG: STAS domain-containing protein [Methylococcaceae bacterium]